MTKLRLSEIETFIRFRPTAEALRGYCAELVRALEDVEAELRKPPLSPNNPNDLIGLIRDLQQAAVSKEDNVDTVRREALEEAERRVRMLMCDVNAQGAFKQVAEVQNVIFEKAIEAIRDVQREPK